MKIKTLICLVFIVGNILAQVDSVVFCLSNKGMPGLYLSKVNVNTGVVTYISPSVIGNAVSGNGSTIDPYKSIYYFMDFGPKIVSLDLNTGTIVASSPLANPNTDSFMQIIFNASDSVIYGLAGTASPHSIYLGKINPNTGLVTKISTSSLSSAQLGSSATIDPFNKIYYYVNENNEILGVDLNSGNAVSTASITNVNGQYFDLMQFNASDKVIYGLARKPSPPEVYLAKINPITGVVTNISMSSLSTGVSSSGSILDPCNNNYYYLQGGGMLTGASCSTGNNIVAVTSSSQILEMRYNYKCFLNFSFSGIDEKTKSNKALVYPNPTSEYLNFELQNQTKISEIEITNAIGQIILKQIYNKQIDVSSLNTGCYFIKLISEDGTILHSKFLKE